MLLSIFKILKKNHTKNTLQKIKKKKKKFQEEFNWFLNLANNKKNEFLSEEWNIKLDYAQRRAGACYFDKKILTFSKKFIRQANKTQIHDIILHEIAHAIVGPGQGHNSIWKSKAIEIGCSGEIYIDYDFSEPKWIKYCENGCWEIKAFRRKSHLMCRNCSGNVMYKKNN